MEGLLLAEALRPLEGGLPLDRGHWRFPDDRTVALPLTGGDGGAGQVLWILSRPPAPWLALRPGPPPDGVAGSPFQELLASRATGPLRAARQRGLDRVVELDFAASEGFVTQPAVTLVVELTGRNANLVLLDEGRTILGVERVVLHGRNRYRELRPGVDYLPPPPYHKLDPRTASRERLLAVLHGQPLTRVRSILDGIGPELGKALAVGCGIAPGAPLQGQALERVADALPALAAAPASWLERAGRATGLEEQRRLARRQRAERTLAGARNRELEVARKRLQDLERARDRGSRAGQVRGEADLLMAYPAKVPAGSARVALPGFDGVERELVLDPRLDAFGNARKRYDRARRLERRAERAERERPAAEITLRQAEEALARLPSLSDEEIATRAAALVEARRKRQRPAGPGIRFAGPHGFEVVVGRNARENDAVTFALARSLDLWLHVQGFTGAHVVVRAGGAEVPFDTVLFAARLAAGFSPARHSDNVAVDYTLRKNVWKVKGQPPGAVRFSHQKTVFVTPARDAAGAAGDEPS